MARNLSPAMRGMLRNLAQGKPATYGLNGRSAHGGAVWTMSALYRRELIVNTPHYGPVLTDAGRAALAEAKEARK